ncbi:MAG: pimeloyl-ACP methyl esterase BioG family protein [Chlorobiaceae bacterium]
MKNIWLRKKNADKLLLFFNGWGMDWRIAAHLLCESISGGFNQDFLVCYDYSNLEPEPEFIHEAKHYGHVTVVAWSFGVWVAQHIELPSIERAIAINGTLYPINDQRGISSAVFKATLSSYSEEVRDRFNRRMCGSSEALALFSTMSPDRAVSEQKKELEQLNEYFLSSSLSSCATWKYDHAIIGGRDLVFPAEQQYNAWKGVPQTVIADMPHFPFFHFGTLQELLVCVRK